MNEVIFNRIKKLLALSDSSNEYEAQRAADKAQELLSVYNLTLSDLPEDATPIDKVTVLESKQVIKWRRTLLGAVASFYDCKTLQSKRGQLLITDVIGSQANVLVTGLMYEYFVNAVELLAKTERNNGGKSTPTFKFGVAIRLSDRLNARKLEMVQDGFGDVSALVVQTQSAKAKQEVTAWMQKHFPNTRKIRTNCPNSDAFDKGYGLGGSIGIDTQMAGSYSQPRLGHS